MKQGQFRLCNVEHNVEPVQTVSLCFLQLSLQLGQLECVNSEGLMVSMWRITNMIGMIEHFDTICLFQLGNTRLQLVDFPLHKLMMVHQVLLGGQHNSNQKSRHSNLVGAAKSSVTRKDLGDLGELRGLCNDLAEILVKHLILADGIALPLVPGLERVQ